jgi:hypothetical protein
VLSENVQNVIAFPKSLNPSKNFLELDNERLKIMEYSGTRMEKTGQGKMQK